MSKDNGLDPRKKIKMEMLDTSNVHPWWYARNTRSNMCFRQVSLMCGRLTMFSGNVTIQINIHVCMSLPIRLSTQPYPSTTQCHGDLPNPVKKKWET